MTEYHNPVPVTAAPINPQPGDINAILKDDKRFAGQAVDWVVSQFGDLLGFGDQGLYDYLVRPLAGDYSRIKANGQAWADCGTMLRTVQTNLVRTSVQLVTSDWKGKAATAFASHVDVVFGAGMYAAEKGCDYVGKGFDKLSELSVRIAQKCVTLLNIVIDKIIKLFGKMIPGFGTVWSIVEWVASGFDKAPYISDVEEIVELVNQVRTLHQTLTKLVTDVTDYFEGVQAMVQAVAGIPEVDSTSKAAEIAKQFGEGRDKAKKARADADKQAASAQRQLDQIAQPVDVATR
ncbi:hypothetical protein [Actinophytocola oryzae]|uniref:Type VII secretion system (Wss) protein ESAT-6 n=1 Tax=Actinophytocola oryzae TaxID=502181 RepID=A0A4R7V1B7_9PSEU|nr:hypothetical protein [Actinophytocola oryzae]TDV43088.1 hypothetical protein CLV71_11622 [Actinophytocola oryzae]